LHTNGKVREREGSEERSSTQGEMKTDLSQGEVAGESKESFDAQARIVKEEERETPGAFLSL